MKLLHLALLFPLHLSAESMENYRFYQTDNIIPDNNSPYFSAFIKKNNPCIFVKDLKKNTTHEYCKMGNSGLDLKRDTPSIYPTRVYILGSTLFFNVAAPWNEQRCEIFLGDKSITCEPTGKN
ncbi:MAG: hypothetical protein ACPGUE_19395 [Marinomonas sp.]